MLSGCFDGGSDHDTIKPLNFGGAEVVVSLGNSLSEENQCRLADCYSASVASALKEFSEFCVNGNYSA